MNNQGGHQMIDRDNFKRANMYLFNWIDGELKINAKFAFHMFSVWGFPKEMTEEELNRLFPPKSIMKGAAICEAYDRANGTNHLEIFENET